MTTRRCKVFGHKLRDDMRSGIPVYINKSLMGYDVTRLCIRNGCDHIEPVAIFYGAETPWALYLEPTTYV